MADESEKNIEDVSIGEKVKSYDAENGSFVEGTVMSLESPVRDHISKITFSNGLELNLTNEHPLYTKKGWASLDPESTLAGHGMKVKTLRVGDEIRHEKEEWLKIESIYTQAKSIKVYNLARVEPLQTYLADGFVAHNKPDSEFSDDTPGGDSGGGEGATTGTGTPGEDGADAGGNEQNLGAPGGGSGGNDGTSGNMPGGGSAAGGGTGNNSNTNNDGSNSGPGNSSPGGGSGSSTNNTGSNNPGGSSGSGNSGTSPGGSGSGYPGGSSSGSYGGGSKPSYSSSSSFSI
jgi:hypothetical protein